MYFVKELTSVDVPSSIHIIKNLISDEECDYFYNKKLLKFKNRETSKWGDADQVLITENDEEDLSFIDKVNSSFMAAVKEYYGYSKELCVFESNFYIWRENVAIRPHMDNWDPNHDSQWNLFSSVFYLNDDFEGGQIYFPNLKFTYKPEKGSLIMFPDDERIGNDLLRERHLHGVHGAKSGVRMTVATWLQDKEMELKWAKN